MFVVRLKRPREEFDLKAFASKLSALARFRAAQRELIDGDVEECALFEVRRTTDGERAVELVGQGHGLLIESNLNDPRPRGPVRRLRAAPRRRKVRRRTR
jgi:hypothetical protein